MSLTKHKLIVAALAFSLAAVDLVEKALDPSRLVDYHSPLDPSRLVDYHSPLDPSRLVDYHSRSYFWAATSALLVVAAFALAHLRSRAVAISAGVMAGGVLANLISASTSNGRVPNPIVIGTERDGVAFNLADVFSIIGLFGLIGSVCVVLVVHRERLLPPRAWERALWRRIRGR